MLLREGAFYFLFLFTIYLLICLISYAPSDPGWTHNQQPQKILNWGGRFGAYFADLMFHGFGFMAYLVPLLAGLGAVKMYRTRQSRAPDLQHRLITIAGFILTLTGGCGLESMHRDLPSSSTLVPGGVLGSLMAGGLESLLGDIGATLALLSLFLVGFTWFTGISWFLIMDRTGEWVWRSIDYVGNRFAVAGDRVAGARARRERKDSVRTIKQKLERKEPPRIEPRIAPAEPSVRAQQERQGKLFERDSTVDVIPPLSLLEPTESGGSGFSKESLEAMSRLVEKKLNDFNIQVQVVEVHPGPVITRFEIDPAPGVKASQISGLSRDLARALSVVSVRVVENIPGKTYVGLEIPNENRETVSLIDGLSSSVYEQNHSPLSLMLGKDIGGAPVVADLARMPHLLIAGTTGSGKSVCINALILSMLFKATPEQLRLIMIDPKMLELSIYEGIPHLLAPVVTDMQQASNALRWAIAEMERRYKLMAFLGVRNISGYNKKVNQAQASGEPLNDPFIDPEDAAQALTSLPYIVIIIDELADLMMVVGKKVEELITRIAQRARAAGIHLILATQRPSVDVITGLLKANIPTRIAFQVASRVDSRTVLDQMGAEQLLGHGDMLYLPPGSAVPERVHGSFVSDQEVHRVVESLKEAAEPVYDESVLEGEPGGGGDGASLDSSGGEEDPLYDQALRIVTETRRASISAVQRQLRVGYNRAARMIEAMEEAGVVGPLESNGKREVLAPPPPGD